MNKLNLNLSLLLFLLTLSISAQDHQCDTHEFTETEFVADQLSNARSFDCDGNVYRVHFYLLRDGDGNGGIYQELLDSLLVTSEDDYVTQALEILNSGFGFSQYFDKDAQEEHSGNAYAQDIQFVSEGWDYIDDDRVITDTPSPPSYLYLKNSNYSCTAINKYVYGSSRWI